MDKRARLVCNTPEEKCCFPCEQGDHRQYEKRQNAKGVLKEQYVSVSYEEDGTIRKLQMRRITFKDDHGRIYIFITNNFETSAAQVALIYRHRWMMEILFKQIKQNFPLTYF